jgi:CRP-like cAMP-binding protein
LRHIFVLLAGRIEVTVDAHAGYEGVLAVRGPGDIVGEFAAVDGEPRSASIRALDRVEAVVVSAERFSTLCQAHPRLAWAVLCVVVGRLREITRRKAEQGGSTVGKRLVALLIELAAQYGVTEEHGVVIAIPLTQQSLAGMIGASRESVVRALRDLRHQRLITTGRRQVTILRLEALSRLAS